MPGLISSPPHPATLVFVVGEATDLRALRTHDGQTISLVTKPGGSSSAMSGDVLNPDTIGTYVVDVGTAGHPGYTRRTLVAFPSTVDTDARLGADAQKRRLVVQAMLNAPDGLLDLTTISSANPFPTIRNKQPIFAHYGAGT